MSLSLHLQIVKERKFVAKLINPNYLNHNVGIKWEKAIEIFIDVMNGRLDKQKSAKTQESSHVGEHSGKDPELYSSAECLQIVESIEVNDDT